MITIKTRTLGILAISVIFGGIALSAGLGLWNTTSTKEPAKILSGEFAGLPSPSDIRGSYTWAEVSKAFGVPEQSLVVAFGGMGPEEKVNSLEARYAGKLPEGLEIGTDSVRLFVALYTGLPHVPEADTVVPSSAIEILRAEGRADETLLAAAAARSLPAEPEPASPAPAGQAEAGQAPKEPAPPTTAVPKQSTPPAATAPEEPAAKAAGETPSVTEHVPVVGVIVGKTTFYDLQSWGFDMKKVEEILGGTGPSSQGIKDFCAATGLAFSEIKVKLEAAAPK